MGNQCNDTMILYASQAEPVWQAVVRQIAEPRLVGKSLGLHPLLMLISFYAGLRLFGGIGILLGPLSALLLKAVLEHIAEEKRERAASK